VLCALLAAHSNCFALVVAGLYTSWCAVANCVCLIDSSNEAASEVLVVTLAVSVSHACCSAKFQSAAATTSLISNGRQHAVKLAMWDVFEKQVNPAHFTQSYRCDDRAPAKCRCSHLDNLYFRTM
jgi:hypothetical protein